MQTTSSSEEAGTVRAVDRAIQILKCFSIERPILTVVQIQEVLGLSRTTIYRIMDTLIHHKLVKELPDPQRYVLSYAVGNLAAVWHASIDVVAEARPILEELRTDTGETVVLFRLEDGRRISVLDLRTPHKLGFARGLGETEHISRGASGKAILAYAIESVFREAMGTAPPETDEARLRTELREVRERGYALTAGEVFVGAIGVSAPYFDSNGAVAGSVGLFAPQARVEIARLPDYAKKVVAAAARVSSALGAPPGAKETAAERAGAHEAI
jgi:DNA-binding IclR family transcriptional regulator